MTLLGFQFDNRPSIAAHMGLIKKKFNCRVWLLRHLKQAGVSNKDVAQIYASTIRSAVEYAAPIYGPMMNSSQSNDLEKMQRQALKIIYGYRTSYENALAQSNLTRLDVRRNEIVEKFAKKLPENFSRWLPERPDIQYGLRRRTAYLEGNSQTERLYRSPLFTYRRILNGL